jgi:hypothetical protein
MKPVESQPKVNPKLWWIAGAAVVVAVLVYVFLY